MLGEIRGRGIWWTPMTSPFLTNWLIAHFCPLMRFELFHNSKDFSIQPLPFLSDKLKTRTIIISRRHPWSIILLQQHLSTFSKSHISRRRRTYPGTTHVWMDVLYPQLLEWIWTQFWHLTSPDWAVPSTGSFLFRRPCTGTVHAVNAIAVRKRMEMLSCILGRYLCKQLQEQGLL